MKAWIIFEDKAVVDVVFNGEKAREIVEKYYGKVENRDIENRHNYGLNCAYFEINGHVITILCTTVTGYEPEKQSYIDWISRMNKKHGWMASDADDKSEKCYHLGQAHAYYTAERALKDKNLRDVYEKRNGGDCHLSDRHWKYRSPMSKYEQISAEHEGTEK